MRALREIEQALQLILTVDQVIDGPLEDKRVARHHAVNVAGSTLHTYRAASTEDMPRGGLPRWVYHVGYPEGVAKVSIRELRNQGGDVVDRAVRGEQITITRAGRAVAELRAVSQPALSAETLLRRWRLLPQVNPVALRKDVDELLDASL